MSIDTSRGSSCILSFKDLGSAKINSLCAKSLYSSFGLVVEAMLGSGERPTTI